MVWLLGLVAGRFGGKAENPRRRNGDSSTHFKIVMKDTTCIWPKKIGSRGE
jgi:hypothetical protein